MISARNLFRRHQQRLDVFLGVAIDQARPPESCATSARNWPGPSCDGHDMPETVVPADGHRTLQHHEHSGARSPAANERAPRS